MGFLPQTVINSVMMMSMMGMAMGDFFLACIPDVDDGHIEVERDTRKWVVAVDGDSITINLRHGDNDRVATRALGMKLLSHLYLFR